MIVRGMGALAVGARATAAAAAATTTARRILARSLTNSCGWLCSTRCHPFLRRTDPRDASRSAAYKVARAETTARGTMIIKYGRPAPAVVSVNDLKSLDQRLDILSDRR